MIRQARWFKNQGKENDRGGGSDRRGGLKTRARRTTEEGDQTGKVV